MALLPALLALCGSLSPTGNTDDSSWHELTLDNGIEVIVFEAPLAEQQAFFTMLPLGLLDDEADRAQFSHLVEHLMVRSTDPDSLVVDDLIMNGETTALVLRLESFADHGNWEKAFDRHVAWLTADEVDPDVLAQEKVSIALEEENTADRGYTHKWALSAWNQVVRHDNSRVGLHGDIADASVEDARDYLRRRLRSGPGVLFVSVGPVPMEEIASKLHATLGELPEAAWPASVPSVPKESILAQQDRLASWDLDARHYMEWYPVPGETALDRVLADAVAMLLNVKIQQRGAFSQLGVIAQAQADLVSPEGRWLLISASLPPGISVAQVRGELVEVVESLGTGREPELVIQQLRQQLTEDADFAAIRQSVGPERARWIEAQQVIFMLYAQQNMGLGRAELVEAYKELDVAGLISFADLVLAGSRRSTLLLEPDS